MDSIIVIEDDPAILRGLADNLRHESYEVLTAADGEKGFQLISQRNPDLVILDLMLPGLNGYEVCRQMRRNGLDTPVLMLTAIDQEAARIQGFEAGADDYVAKPFSLRELLGRVRAILRRKNHGLDEARMIQVGFLPGDIPQMPGLRMGAVWRPVQAVGGDYYDVIKIDANTVAVCIADVCGKGLPAAMLMSNLQAAARAYASEALGPGALCERVNRMMCVNTPSNNFISFFYAVMDTRRKKLTYCNAGHNPPILLRSGGCIQRLDRGGGILGVFADWQYKECEIAFDSGDRLLMYTDGITEAQNSEGEEFGDRRLSDLMIGLQGASPGELTEIVVSTVSAFSNGNFKDDVTVLAVEVPPAACLVKSGSGTTNPASQILKSEIANWTAEALPVQSAISDFRI